MWNVGISERGWRPGAVRNSVAKIMRLYLTPPKPPMQIPEKKDPPTLRIQKKNGEFTIVMNPLRDDKNFNEEQSPVVFKLEKSEAAKQRSMARRALNDHGVKSSCDCSTLQKCKCMNECEKARLKFELMKVSRDFCIKPELSLCDLKETSESEIDVEFTPPSAARLHKPVKVSAAATQYESQVLKHTCDGREESLLVELCDKRGGTNDVKNDQNAGKNVEVKNDKKAGTKARTKNAKQSIATPIDEDTGTGNIRR